MQSQTSYLERSSSKGIFYRIYGQEKSPTPLLMVMGYGGCMFAWPLEFVGKLAQNRPVIIFDNRGTGRSAALEGSEELRIGDFANDIKFLLADLGISKADIFGYSMGGCVSLEFAYRYPEHCRRMILQSTTAGGSMYTGADPEIKERLANPRGSNFDEMLFDFFDLCMTQNAIEDKRLVLEGICANARPYPTSPRVLQAQLKAFRNFDASEYCSLIKQEVLLLHGHKDRILKIENGVSLASALANCKSQFFDDCGHCPHIEHETAVVSELSAFLNG
ncbi:MAG: alpha/beta hydrolase [Candidatus Obscuribacterales bacterium]|nr:alpha/beta hydrolase [Candidatus Obscuribacterales bacterium]